MEIKLKKWKAETRFEEWAKFNGQNKLADKLGVSRQLVNQWLMDHKRPSDNLKLRIIEFSGGLLSIDDFFRDIDLGL